MQKFIYDDIYMEKDDNKFNVYVCNITTIYDDTASETIQGLSLHLKAIQQDNFIYLSYSLRYKPELILKQHTDIIAQLEVDEPSKISHRDEKGDMFGTHYHRLNETLKIDDKPEWDWHNWLAFFFDLANITHYGNRKATFTEELRL